MFYWTGLFVLLMVTAEVRGKVAYRAYHGFYSEILQRSQTILYTHVIFGIKAAGFLIVLLYHSGPSRGYYNIPRLRVQNIHVDSQRLKLLPERFTGVTVPVMASSCRSSVSEDHCGNRGFRQKKISGD
jgi:hypothetical protein